jgi:hypothetical protein
MTHFDCAQHLLSKVPECTTPAEGYAVHGEFHRLWMK